MKEDNKENFYQTKRCIFCPLFEEAKVAGQRIVICPITGDEKDRQYGKCDVDLTKEGENYVAHICF